MRELNYQRGKLIIIPLYVRINLFSLKSRINVVKPNGCPRWRLGSQVWCQGVTWQALDQEK